MKNFNKTVAYLDILEKMGTRIDEPVIKHLNRISKKFTELFEKE